MRRRKLVLLAVPLLILLPFVGVFLLAPTNAELQGEWELDPDSSELRLTMSVRGNTAVVRLVEPTGTIADAVLVEGMTVHFRQTGDGRLLLANADAGPPVAVLGRVIFWRPEQPGRGRYELVGDTLRVCVTKDGDDYPPAVNPLYGQVYTFIRRR